MTIMTICVALHLCYHKLAAAAAAAAAALARLVAVNTRSCKLATHSSTQDTRAMAQGVHLLLLLNVCSKRVQDAGRGWRHCFSFRCGLRYQNSVQLSAQSDRYLHCSRDAEFLNDIAEPLAQVLQHVARVLQQLAVLKCQMELQLQHLYRNTVAAAASEAATAVPSFFVLGRQCSKGPLHSAKLSIQTSTKSSF